jgi:hypothetical protein
MLVALENIVCFLKWPSFIAKLKKSLCYEEKKFGRIDSRFKMAKMEIT